MSCLFVRSTWCTVLDKSLKSTGITVVIAAFVLQDSSYWQFLSLLSSSSSSSSLLLVLFLNHQTQTTVQNMVLTIKQELHPLDFACLVYIARQPAEE